MKIPQLFVGPFGRLLVVRDGQVRKVGWKGRFIYIAIMLGFRVWSVEYTKRKQANAVKRANLAGHNEGFAEGIKAGVEIGQRHADHPWVTGTTLYSDEFPEDEIAAPTMEVDGHSFSADSEQFRQYLMAKHHLGDWVLVDDEPVKIDAGECDRFFYPGMEWVYGSVTQCLRWYDHWLVATLGVSGQVYIHAVHMDGSLCTEKIYTDWSAADRKWAELMALPAMEGNGPPTYA